MTKRSTERKQLLARRSTIYRELTQMSYKGWDQYKSGDYRPLEVELDRIKDRLALLKEMQEHIEHSEVLMQKYKGM